MNVYSMNHKGHHRVNTAQCAVTVAVVYSSVDETVLGKVSISGSAAAALRCVSVHVNYSAAGPPLSTLIVSAAAPDQSQPGGSSSPRIKHCGAELEVSNWTKTGDKEQQRESTDQQSVEQKSCESLSGFDGAPTPSGSFVLVGVWGCGGWEVTTRRSGAGMNGRGPSVVDAGTFCSHMRLAWRISNCSRVHISGPPADVADVLSRSACVRAGVKWECKLGALLTLARRSRCHSPTLSQVALVMMALRLPWLALSLAALAHLSASSPHTCAGVRREFVLRQVGEGRSVPDAPRTGSDLQVCMSRNLTCCTRKMEERYQFTARRDIQNLLQTTSSSLKGHITHSVAGLQEAVESLVRHAQNQTVALLLSTYRDLAERAAPHVSELFTDMGLFVLGAELGLEEAVQRFFHALFPPVFERLVEPGLDPLDPAYGECVRSVGRGLAPYGSYPGMLAKQLTRASLPNRVLLQALHLGVEVINTTDHLQLSRECRKALLRMSYCPHCQALISSRPCMGYCLNVLRGCLASLAEVDSHWREFVRSLEALSTRMSGGADLERALAAVPTVVRDAIAHAHKNAPWLSTQIRGACGHPSRLQSGGVQQGVRDSLPLRVSAKPAEETLSSRRQDFVGGLRLYRAFYGGLADQLCVTELASGDGLACWNGADVVRSYTQRVVGSGIKAQAENPEVRVKEADPVINQVIDKLKHINQLLQGRSIPKLGTLDLIETGSGDTEGPYSGDCDDEDGCWGSGSGPGVRRTTIGTTKSPPNAASQDPPNSASFTARISACMLKRSGQIAQPHSL
ncbi:glypican-5a [Colossoma macropomum]|uniref:glypican-5a n=1 Tax=Colossoma macropomum TaxID=42526 RepID=UPI001864E88E|nr:glypican-5a [Colossoma macropomum]